MICRRIAGELDGYSVNETSLLRERKHLPRISFVSDTRGLLPTIGMTSWGTIDFKGGNGKPSEIIDISKKIVKAFDTHKKFINFNLTSKRTVKITTQCRKGQPEAKDGNCPEGMVPVPAKSQKGLCCKKKKLTKSVAKNIIRQYENANMNIPESLQRNLNKFRSRLSSVNVPSGVSSIIPSSTINSFNYKQGIWYYKSKPFNCTKKPFSKPELQKIARLLNVNPDGFRNVLCSRITNKLSTLTNN